VDTPDGELETSLGGSRDGLLAFGTFGGGGFSRLSLSGPEGRRRKRKEGRKGGDADKERLLTRMAS
jgi:hypothetical protein